MRAEGAWPIELELLATIVEQLDNLTRLQWAIGTGGKRPPWKPVHVPRPDRPKVAKRPPTAGEMAAFLGGGAVSNGR